MIEDKGDPKGQGPPRPANDNDRPAAREEDVHILRIAEAIGRKLARDYIRRLQAANDNAPGDRENPRWPTES